MDKTRPKGRIEAYRYPAAGCGTHESVAIDLIEARVPGGSLALIKGVAKRLIELDDEALANGTGRVIDIDFIKRHTLGFNDFAEVLRKKSWPLLEAESGVSREDIEGLTRTYANGERITATWRVSITQQKHAVQTVHLLSSLLMMRGNIGQEGAGLCPVCRNSNVQSRHTVGVEEKAPPDFLNCLGKCFDFEQALTLVCPIANIGSPTVHG